MQTLDDTSVERVRCAIATFWRLKSLLHRFFGEDAWAAILGSHYERHYLRFLHGLLGLLETEPALAALRLQFPVRSFPESLSRIAEDSRQMEWELVVEPALQRFSANIYDFCNEHDLPIHPTSPEDCVEFGTVQSIEGFVVGRRGIGGNPSTVVPKVVPNREQHETPGDAEEPWLAIPPGRDREMVRMLWNGSTMREIGDQFGLVKGTVETIVSKLRTFYGEGVVPKALDVPSRRKERNP